MVLAHARALLASSPEGRCAYIDADIRDPEKILDAAAEVLDFTEPVARGADGGAAVRAGRGRPARDRPPPDRSASPPGSYLVISHPAADIQAAAMAGMATRLNQLMAQRVKPRSREEVTAFFDGLEPGRAGRGPLPGVAPGPPRGRGGQVDDVGRRRAKLTKP